MLARPKHSPQSVLTAARALLHAFAATTGKRGTAAAGYVLLAALLEGVGVSLLVPFLGIIVGGAGQGLMGRGVMAVFRALGVTTAPARLFVLLCVFGAAMIARAIALAGRDIRLAELQFHFVESLRLQIIRRLAAARWDRIAHLRHARIAHVMSGDVQRLGIGVNAFLLGSVAAIMLSAQCLLAVLLAPAAGGLIILMLAIALATVGPALAAARRVGGDVAAANLLLLDSSLQFLGGLKLATSQNLQQPFVAQAARALTHLAERQNDHVRQQTCNRAAVTALSALAGGALVLAGFAWLHLAPAVLMTLLVIVSRMTAPLGQIQLGLQQLAHTLAIYEDIRTLDSSLAEAAAPAYGMAKASQAPSGDIVFHKVSYSHARDHQGAGPGLHDLDLTIRRGEFLGITGTSGSGKTTFADLLAGLYPPQAGRITVAGIALAPPLLTAWRDGLSYVAQDSFLFHDSVRNNLTWANPQLSDDAIWAALAVAGADEVVRKLVNGLDTVAGERGMLISGGERQRIALARALLRRPRLLILDEATGAIDSAAERAIFTRLRNRDITIVTIAHRRENLTLCDRVLDWDLLRSRVPVTASGHFRI